MVQGNFIQRGGFNDGCFMPPRNFGYRDQETCSSSKSRCVQGLANVADGFVARRVLV